MKYANIITLKEFLYLNIAIDKFVVVHEGTHEEIEDFEEKEYRVNFISSTSYLVPTGKNMFYEADTEFKPDAYKRQNLMKDKEWVVKTKVVIYVMPITNEVKTNEQH